MKIKNIFKGFSIGLINTAEDLDKPRRYTYYRRNIIIIMLLITLVPLTLMLIINYNQYRKSLNSQISVPLARLTNKTRHSIELFLEERLSTVSFVASAYSFEELADEKNIQRILRVLKKASGGFVDLGLVDGRGILVSYAGPYKLLGKDYSQQDSFHEALIRGAYISDVFMGYRKIPHIVIAAQHLAPDGNSWILRATINTELFDNLIGAMGIGSASDVFLVNREGVLQTDSKFYGKVLEKCPFPIPKGNQGTFVQEVVDSQGREIMMVYSFFRHPGYTLVLVKPRYEVMKEWYTLKNKMLVIFGFSVVLIILFVIRTTQLWVSQIQELDSRREKMLRELENSQKLSSIGRLAAGVAHEINNPLAIINQKAGLMNDIIEFSKSFDNKEKFIKLTDSILYSVERCRAITHRLLGFARRIEVQFQKLDINSLVKEVMGFLEREAFYRKIEIRFDLDDSLLEISSDKGQLEQVFLNLATNAFAAVEDGGEILITSMQKGADTIVVSFSDNGCGMDHNTSKHIFEPFFTTKKGYGTGLGLSITYGIVKKLGGDIEVDSNVGEGSTFTLSLPVKPMPGEE